MDALCSTRSKRIDDDDNDGGDDDDEIKVADKIRVGEKLKLHT